MYNIGDQFYDEKNGRYLTIYGKSRDTCLCTVEEMDEECNFYEIGDQLFSECELSCFIRQE